jgi:predicted RNase H-like nuclease (RuvC/YqgF family)
MSITSRRSLLSVATVNADPAYLNHKIKQQEIQIRALDQQLFESEQARAELEARLAESDDDTDTRSSNTCDAEGFGAQEELFSLQLMYGECVEENRRLRQDVKTLKSYTKELHEKVCVGRCKVHWQ